MTIYRRLNQNGFGGHYTTWWLVKTMLDAGWTVPMSGSGTGGLYATSNVFDLAQSPIYYTGLGPNGVGVGSEPWGYQSCWIVLEDPSGNRQVAFQRSGSAGNFYDGDWNFYYSPGGRFGEGQTPGTDWDEDTLPNAPDRGTEASGLPIFEGDADPSICHIAADDTPSPEGEYGVFCIEYKPTNTFSGIFMLDDLRDAPVGHPHPYTVFAEWYQGLTSPRFHATGSVDKSPGTVVGAGTPGEVYSTNCRTCRWTSYVANQMPGSGGVGVDGKERALPLIVVSSGAQEYRGVSRWLYSPSVTRDYPNTGNSQQYLFTGVVLIADLLDGVTTPASI